MGKKLALTGLLAASILAGLLAYAQEAAEVLQKNQAENEYTLLLGRIKQGDSAVDFRTFRLDAALAGRSVSVQEFAEHGLRSRELAGGDYQSALDSAEKTLARNYASVYAQFEAGLACQKLNKPEEAAIHQKLVNGLLESIQASGDGKGPDTAWFVVNTPEEYFLLRQLRLKPQKQELVNHNGHAYDRLDVVDLDTNTALSVWFNTDVDMHIYPGGVPAASSGGTATDLKTPPRRKNE